MNSKIHTILNIAQKKLTRSNILIHKFALNSNTLKTLIKEEKMMAKWVVLKLNYKTWKTKWINW